MDKKEIKRKIYEYEEKIKELKEQLNKKDSGWADENNEGEELFCISSDGSLMKVSNFYNYQRELSRNKLFTNDTKAKRIDFEETLRRKLQKFADEHNQNDIDWHNTNSAKFYIHYDYGILKFSADNYSARTRQFGQVYFDSKQTVEKAIKLFKDELQEYFLS